MRLFLASELEVPSVMESALAWIDDFASKKFVYIPTGLNGENTFESWKKDDGIVNQLRRSGVTFTTCQLEDSVHSPILNVIEQAEVIIVGGGMSGYLMYWMHRAQIVNVLTEMITKEHVHYIGSSTGAMITGKTMDVARNFIGSPEYGAEYIPTLHLVDFDIYPHYDEVHFEAIKAFYTGPKLYLLKNDEFITVKNEEVTIFGEEKVIVS